MTFSIKLDKRRIFERKILPFLAFAFIFAIFVFSCFYIFSSYDQLVKWYIGLNDCFYRNQSWTNNFFSPQIKSYGNAYCLFAMTLASLLLFYLVKRIKVPDAPAAPYTITIDMRDLSLIGRCVLVATLFWIWGKSLVAPSNDEVFSAVYCAGMHPFQTVSYYMHPNNHILFNFLNNIVFHGFSDKVLTGRFISLFCYWGVIVICYYWLTLLLPKKWLAALLTLTMALQFPIWGFAFQNRGYELEALCEWVTFISFFRYCFTEEKKWLYMGVIATVAGYFCMPTFLYCHVAIIVLAFFYQIVKKQTSYLFWIFLVISLALTYLLYVPCLCFSGIRSITANQYVTGSANADSLISNIIPSFKSYLDYCFSWFIMADNTIDCILFFVPLTLLFYQTNKIASFLGWFYFSMWGSCLLLVSIMKILPPLDRTLIWQCSFTLALSMYSIYLFLSAVAGKIKKATLTMIFFPVLLSSLSINFMLKNKWYVSIGLCHFDANTWYQAMNLGVSNIPKGSAVAFSDECFYWYYLCNKYGYVASRCAKGNEDYFVKHFKDQFPPGMENIFIPEKTIGDYIIYKRK